MSIAVASIVLESLAFAPPSLTIKVGDTVTWVNPAGAGTHNVVADDNSFTSGSPALGPWSYSRTFTVMGTFGYFCAPHGAPGGLGQSGTITVFDALEVVHGSDPAQPDQLRDHRVRPLLDDGRRADQRPWPCVQPACEDRVGPERRAIHPSLPGTSGTVTITHNGRYGDLAGKIVALEPATGFSFDTPMAPRVK